MKIKEAVKFILKSNLIKFKYFKKPVVMDSNLTLEYILKNKCSIARYGDGELSLMEGRNIKFQSYSQNLAKRLKEVKTTNKCLVCIPNIFNKKSLNSKLITKEEYVFWKRAKLVFGGFWNKYFSKQEKLGDAFLSRFYIRYKDKSTIGEYIEKLKTLWNNQNVIIVEGETSQIGVGNDILNNAKSIRRIICPNINAFDCYDEILNAIKKHYKKDDIVLLALGPTATVLAYDLSNIDIWALDMGHFDIEYEWFLAKTDVKIPVKNKHVNECGTMGVVNNTDAQYNNEIVEKIKK